METETKQNLKLPKYLKAFYGWLYGSKFWSGIFENKIIQTIYTLGYNYILSFSVLKEISYGNKVLQVGVVFGPLMEGIADKIGSHGRYDVLDVSKLQLQRTRNKFQYIYPNINLIQQNAAQKFPKGEYDVVVCYMLLHEVPPLTKVKIIENSLNAINDNGRVVFIDYSNPVIYHPLRYLVRMFNRLFQPFAEKLWDLNIADYCNKPLRYNWRKKTFFGHFYQKVVVNKRKTEI